MGFVTPTVPSVGDQITAAQGAVIAGDLNSGPNMGAPVSTASNGTATAGGAVEIRDAVLGNYTFTAVAGRRYRAVVDGLGASTTVAGDAVVLNIRNGGASTPTAASTAVASAKAVLPASSSGLGIALAGTFVPGAGTVTLSLFTVRVAGTGMESPTSNTGVVNRELYVVDIGPA